jgi:hypothetical protein
MSDEPSVHGWLPPRAPGGESPPRFETAPLQAPEPAESWQPPSAERRHWEPAPVPTARPESNGLAIGAIVLGVLSVGLLLMSLGTSFVFSLPMSGAAWAFGARARQRAPEGGPAQAAVVIGMVGVGLAVAAAVIWIALFSAGISLEDLRDYLERKLEEQRR